jgi:ATP-binding cassette, subfamily B, bacterial CvaB/MchF/RaxB
MKSMFTRRRVIPVLQAASAECGLACATMILSYWGVELSLAEVRRGYLSQRGNSLRSLIALFDDFRVSSRPVRVELEDLDGLELPSILHWDFEHFVVLERCSRWHAHIIDPRVGRNRVRWSDFSNHFTGIALEVTAPRPRAAPRPPAKRAVWSLFSGAKPAISRLFISVGLLTLAVNALSLSLPLLLKVVFDKVIPHFRLGILEAAAAGFFLLAVLQFFVQSIRAHGLARFRQGMSEHLVNSVFNSLIWSKSSFFEARSTGALLNQYRSANEITLAITETVIARIIDGLAVLIGIVIIFAMTWKVALTIVLTVAAFLGIFFLLQPELKSRLSQTIQAEGKESSLLLETIGAMRTVKLHLAECMRIAVWQNIHSDVESAKFRYGILRSRMQAALELVSNIGWIATIYILVLELERHSIGVGTLTAWASWSTFVLSRCREVMMSISEVGALQEHVARIDDILASEKEAGSPVRVTQSTLDHDLSVRPLTLSNVCFRYDRNGPWLLRNCNLSLEPGKLTVVSGESGVGKTTLLKIVLGLLEPSSGSIKVGERVLSADDIIDIRRYSSTVMQNETLFMGSLADNISFFDSIPDHQLLRKCTELACLSELIDGLPMKYETLVGRDGAGFSAGQLQRIALARALYRRPKLLLLDEFTSNLDETLETRILRNLRTSNITMLTMAHRANVIHAADALYRLDRSGTLLSLQEEVTTQKGASA